MFAVRRIDHVELYVRDIDAAVRWYGGVLGFEVLHRWEPEPVFLTAGGTSLALFRAAPDAPPPVPGNVPTPLRFNRVAFLTDAVGFAAAQAHLKASGVAFRGPIDHEIAWSVYFDDPDGHPLEVTYYPAPAPESA